jgi:phosphate starvation-inducible PhoH-like protein
VSAHEVTQQIEFSDNHLLSELLGPQDRYVSRIEQRLGVTIAIRGNQCAITGPETEVGFATHALQALYEKLQRQHLIDLAEVDSAIHMASSHGASVQSTFTDVFVQTKKRIVIPRTQTQSAYIQQIQKYDLTFGVGPAGTGKTYLAVAVGVSLLLSGKIDRIILTRPAVEAGERLGFLPGDMRGKVDPYLRPLYDALNDMLSHEQVAKWLATGEIEIAPLAFMRGRTLSNACVILDEAQNTTSMQMKMFLTRLGANSKMIITGDLTQIDLPFGAISGLKESVRVLKGISDIAFSIFTDEDVVRHPLISKIVKAYDRDTEKHGV